MAVYTSTQNGVWDDAATWGGGGFPAAGDTANCGHDITLDSAEECATLNVTANELDLVSYDLTVSGTSTVSGGTLSVGSSTFKTRIIAMSSGTINNDTGTLKVTGQTGDTIVNFTGGTFNRNTGTFEFEQSGKTGLVANMNSVDLYDLLFDGGGSEYITVNGNPTVKGKITIDNWDRIEGNVNFEGDIDLTGGGMGRPEAAVLTFTAVAASGDQTITTVGAAAGIGGLVVNKAADDVVFDTSGGQLRIGLSATGELTETSGSFDFTTNSTDVEIKISSGTSTMSGGINFYDLEWVSVSNPQISVGGGSGDIIVSNDLTFAGVTGNNRIISTGKIQVSGNIVINQSGWYNSTIGIEWVGSGSKTITANASNYYPAGGTFTINGSGTLALASDINLAKSGQDLVVSAGTLDCATFNLTVNDTMTLSGGTFLGGSGDITCNTAILSGAAVTGTSGTWLCTAGSTTAWNKTAGTFTHNSGTVKFSAAAQTIVPDTDAYWNVILEPVVSSNIAMAGTWDINGTLTTAEAGKLQGGGTINLSGNLSLGHGSVVAGDDIVLNIDGSTDQNITGSATAKGGFGEILINSTGGTVTFTDWISCSGDLIYTSGTVDATAGNITFNKRDNSRSVSTGAVVWGDVTWNHGGTSLETTTITGTFIVGGDWTFTYGKTINGGTLEVRGNAVFGSDNVTGTATIKMNGSSGDQEIQLPSGSIDIGTMPLLISNTSGIVKLGGATGNMLTTDTVTVDAGAALCSNSNDLTVSGTFTNNGTVTEVSGDTVTTPGAGTGTFNEGWVDCNTPPASIPLGRIVVRSQTRSHSRSVVRSQSGYYN